ncbi:hypothetical protein [Shewanella salipaludis]|uniref:Uncharacterized protein n=1 Tax=Shewanella salipaludis TaxID=2723052 RepID=A0A972JM34_9GAMM|nr:hypothetical protein [Shewanella salipaludis]NMH66097.1 hypothetical protein [Shewanella salipaludis]
MSTVDYSKYTLDELFDVRANIDKEAHPENYKALLIELDNRKEEVEALTEKKQEEFIFSIENRLKILGWLQLATSLGFAIVCIYSAFGTQTIVNVMICSVLAIFNGLAGYRLLTCKRYGFELSYINQIFQIVTINTGSFFFSYSGLGSFIVGIGNGVFVKFSVLSPGFGFFVGENSGQFSVGIDLVAIFFLIVLNSCNELGLLSKTDHKINSTPGRGEVD